ncbi:MAG: hypothetical protein J5I90_13660 [Caldilineales bacterium]|nr:hypothetical protein [Caldilineales bacterium]
MNSFERIPVWQIVVLALAVLLGAAALGFVLFQPNTQETAQIAPSATAPWPTQRPARTATPTLTPTITPEPAATDTPTPTSTPSPTPSPSPTPTPRVSILSMQALGRLETADFVMETVIDLADGPDNLFRSLRTDRILLIARG